VKIGESLKLISINLFNGAASSVAWIGTRIKEVEGVAGRGSTEHLPRVARRITRNQKL
jgi:hypothetical protein